MPAAAKWICTPFPAPRHLRACRVATLLLAVAPLSGAAGEPASVDSLWISQPHRVFRVDAHDFSTLLEISPGERVLRFAVDRRQALVWITDGEGLQGFDYEGELRFSALLEKRPCFEEDGGCPPFHLGEERDEDEEEDGDEQEGPSASRILLEVNPQTGSIWLAHGHTLHHFDSQAQLLNLLVFPGRIRALALDTTAALLWGATADHIFSMDETASVVQLSAVEKNRRVRDLALDSASGELWVLFRDRVARLDHQGELLFESPLRKGRQIASDYDGGVWVLAPPRLLRFGPGGEQALQTGLPKGSRGKPLALAAHPLSGSAWLMGTRQLWELDGAGQILSHLDLKGFEGGGRLRQLRLDIDTIPPLLEWREPAPETFLNHSTPSLRLRYRDVGRGINPDTLRLYADRQRLYPTCVFQPQEIECQPGRSLSEGRLRLAATIEDFNGNLSAEAALFLTIDTRPPVITLLSPADGMITNVSEQSFSGRLDEPAVLTLNGEPLEITPQQVFNQPVVLREGINVFELQALDRAGNLSSLNVEIHLDTLPPLPVDLSRVRLASTPARLVLLTAEAGSVEAETRVLVTNRASGQTVAVVATSEGSFEAGIEARAGDPLSLLVVDAAGNLSPPAELRFDPPPAAPVLEPVPDQTIPLGSTFQWRLTAADPDGDPLTYSVSPLPLPTGASLDGRTGEFTFTPNPEQGGRTYPLTFHVSDGTFVDSQPVTLQVPVPPPGSVTQLSGRLLDVHDFLSGLQTPVVGATVSLLGTGVAALSDANGNFRLSDVPSGSQILDIDPATAPPEGPRYAAFREEIELIDGVTNVITRPFFLPRIDADSLTTVDPAATTTVTNANVNVTLTIPPLTAKDESGRNFEGQMSISEVPEGLAPAALPDELDPGLLITIQPVGVTFERPVEITFPNIDGLPPGTETDIWSLDPETGSFQVVGRGQVSTDGSVIETISGGVRAADWHFTLALQVIADKLAKLEDTLDIQRCTKCPAGSQTTLASGSLIVEHELVSYRSLGQWRSLKLVYNSLNADPQPTIASDLTIPLRSAIPNSISTRLTVAGIDQAVETFIDPRGLDEDTDETIRRVVQFDAGSVPTGFYPYTLELRSNFSASSVATLQEGNILVNNQISSPFGAGWTLDGLSRLHFHPDGSVLVADGDGSLQFFESLPPCLPPPTGVVSWWSMDGHAFDLLDHNNPSATHNLTFGPGQVADGVSFGSGGFIDIDDAASLRNQQFTLSAWVRPDGPGPNNDEFGSVIVQKIPLLNPLTVLPEPGLAWRATDNRFRFLFGQGTNDFVLSTNAFPPGQFYHLAASYDGMTFRLYLDGQLEARKPATQTLSYDEAPWTIGSTREEFRTASPPFPRTWNGIIDEVQIFNRALLDTEVEDIFHAGSGGQCKSPLTDFAPPPGNFTTLRSNPDGTFTQTLKDGTQINFDVDGLQTSVVDRNGNTTTFGYNTNDQLISITDPAGLLTTLAYVGGRLDSMTDPASRVTAFDHDESGNLTEIMDPDGTTRAFAYDARHRMTTQVSKRNFQTFYEYDFAGRNIRVIRPDGSAREVAPSDVGGLVDPAGGSGSETNPAPFVRPSAATATFTDGEGNPTTFSTDPFGAATLTTDALGRQTQIARDAHSNPTRITRPNGAVTTLVYDPRGNLLTSTEEAINATTAFTYEKTFNRVSTVTDPEGNPPTAISYDANGNPVEIIDALGTSTRMAYVDPRCPGQLSSVTAASGLAEENTTTFEYDPATCNLIQTTDPLLNATTLAYDRAGNVSRSTDAEGRITRFRYDSLNRLTQVIDATILPPADPPCGRAGVTCYSYDHAGNLIQITNARGSVTTFAYDSEDRLVRTTDPLGNSETFTYDGNGNLVSTTDRQGQVIEFTYDAAHQLIRKTLLPGTPDEAITTFEYDLVGNLTSAVDPDSALAMTYDPVSRLTSATTRGSPSQPDVTVRYTYDLNGNRLTMTDPEGETGYVYDELNRLTSLMNPSTQAVTFGYDALSRRTRMTMPNGVVSSYRYDKAGQLLGLLHERSGSTLSSYSYGYDGVGNRTTLTQVRPAMAVNSPLDYVYDDLNRLVEATHPVPAGPLETFDYDPVGNRERRDGQTFSAVFDPASRLVEDENFCYAYDLNGNQISKQAKVSGFCRGPLTEYDFDPENQLIQVRGDGVAIANYRYDVLGRRIEKDVQGAITRYVYDNEDILLEFDELNRLLARYTHGSGIDEPLVMERDPDASGIFESGRRFFYQLDGLGSVAELTDAAGGVAKVHVYDSFGQIVSEAGALENPYAYTGREFDSETGLYFYRTRHYNPQIGRFLSEDSVLGNLTFPQSQNRFSYVVNNPVSLVDPFGFTPLAELVKTVTANPKLKALAKGGALFGLSFLVEAAAQNLPPGKLRGTLFLVSAGLVVGSGVEFTALSVASFVGTTVATSGVGVGVGIAGGLFFGALAANSAITAAEFFDKALENFGFVEPQICPVNPGGGTGGF